MTCFVKTTMILLQIHSHSTKMETFESDRGGVFILYRLLLNSRVNCETCVYACVLSENDDVIGTTHMRTQRLY